MARPELKLVPRNHEEHRSTYPTRNNGFFHSWVQEAHSLSRLTSTLVGLLIGTVVMGVFLFVWTKLQVLTSASPTQGPPEYVATSTLHVFSKPGLIKGNRVGDCPPGTRARVIGTANVDGQVWYEIEILSEHPKTIHSLKQKWVLATRLVMARS
jgi:hypothetical protein